MSPAQDWAKSAEEGRKRSVESRVALDNKCQVICLRLYMKVLVTEILGNIRKQPLHLKVKVSVGS